MNSNLKRREFLLGAAKLGLALPTVQMLLRCENAFAAVGNDAYPDSFVMMYTSNGYRTTFEPTLADSFSNFASLGNNVRRAPLAALALPDGSLSPIISNSFNMDHIGVIRGIDWSGTDLSGGGNHNPGAVTTGSSINVTVGNATYTNPTEPSLDQIINEHIRLNSSMEVMTAMGGPPSQGGGWPYWSYKKVGANAVQGIASENRPDVLYNQIIGNISTSPALVQKLKDKRMSVANMISDQFSMTLNSGKKVLSKNDKMFFQQHLDLINDQKVKINLITTNSCTITPPTALVQTSSIEWAHDQVFNRLKAQIDNWILARLCGLSKVLVLHISETDLLDLGTGDNHHGISHYAPDVEWKAKKLPLEKGYMEVFAYLVNRLNTVYDTDSKTLLEKTLCVFNNSAGTIPDGCREAHLAFNYPIVVASRHPSIKAVGNYLDYRNPNIPRYASYQGSPYDWGFKLGVQLNRFHVTLAEAMGLTPAQYLSPVTATIGTHQNNDFNQYEDARVNEPLEGFL